MRTAVAGTVPGSNTCTEDAHRRQLAATARPSRGLGWSDAFFILSNASQASPSKIIVYGDDPAGKTTGPRGATGSPPRAPRQPLGMDSRSVPVRFYCYDVLSGEERREQAGAGRQAVRRRLQSLSRPARRRRRPFVWLPGTAHVAPSAALRRW